MSIKYRFNPEYVLREDNGFSSLRQCLENPSLIKHLLPDTVEFFNLPNIKELLDPLDIAMLITSYKSWKPHRHIVECMLSVLYMAGVDIEISEDVYYYIFGEYRDMWKEFWEEVK